MTPQSMACRGGRTLVRSLEQPTGWRWLSLPCNILGGIGLCLALAGCGREAEEHSRRRFLRELGEHVVLPGYAELALRARTLADACDALCDGAHPAHLEAARTAWKKTRVPLKQAEVFGFGPYLDAPHRLGNQLDFWPLRDADVEELLASEEPLDATQIQGVSLRGLPVAEYLLFAADGEAAFQPGARRCRYLALVASDAVTRAEELHAAWATEFLERLVRSGRENGEFESLAEAFGEIINRLGFIAENVKDRKLGTPLGRKTSGTPQPSQIESRYAGTSLVDARNAIVGIRNVFRGALDEAPETPWGLSAYMRDRGREYGVAAEHVISDTLAAIDAVPQPLSEAITHDPQAVERAMAAVAELQRFLQLQLQGALEVTATFNASDGD